MRNSDFAREYEVHNDDFSFVYANSVESGPTIGLKVEPDLLRLTVPDSRIGLADSKYMTVDIVRTSWVSDPEPIDFVESYGDGSSQGATWNHFSNSVEDLRSEVNTTLLPVPRHAEALQRHLGGLLSISAEGSQAHGEGWTTLYKAIKQAETHVAEGRAWQLEGFVIGLGCLATNFAEREDILVVAGTR